MTVEFSVGVENLKKLITEFSPLGDLSNEAQTRYSFIDRFLKDCLGWSDAGAVKVEVFERGDRTDYECGHPRQLIVEAKKASQLFKFPPRGAKTSFRRKLKSLIDFDANLASAVEQTLNYCLTRGVQLAAVSNGPQLVVFLASRLDGIPPIEGDALVFTSYEDLIGGFAQVYEALSPAGVEERRLAKLLSASISTGLPPKLASSCIDYFQFKYSSDFQENLRNAASLVIEDLARTSDLEEEFLKDCYCGSGPLSQYTLLSKNLLAARYASLFSSEEPGSRLEDVNSKTGGHEGFHQQALAEAMSRRPIVLIGDVGVGKSSFLKNLISVRAEAEFKAAVCIYFDLGSKGILSKTPREALLHVVATTLRTTYKINLQDSTLIESLYKDQLFDFDNGAVAVLKDVDQAEWIKRRLTFIQSLLDKTEEHLRLCIEHLGKKSKKQVIIIIDNADQRDLKIQQEAFLIAQELASHWSSIVFLALRPQTFHASKRSGAISAYPPKVFVIPPPKLEEVIVKRLNFAQKIAKGTLPVQGIAGLTLHVDSLAIVIDVFRKSILENKEILEFIVNVSTGNVRVAIELMSKFFGSPNVESEKIVKLHKEGKYYKVPLHEFAKVALLGDYAFFQEDTSIASNVFSTLYPDKREHFLSLYILGYLAWEGATKEHREGFIKTSAIVEEMQNLGFTAPAVTGHLARLTRKKLVETTERRQLESPEEITESGLPEAFRLTTLGAYHLKKWGGEFSFLEAMAYDTPILETSLRDFLAPHVNDFRLSARFQRAETFADYLTKIWQDLPHPPYFDWNTLRSVGAPSFEATRKYLTDHGLTP